MPRGGRVWACCVYRFTTGPNHDLSLALGVQRPWGREVRLPVPAGLPWCVVHSLNVPRAGLEPALPEELAPQTSVSAYFTTGA